MGTEQTAAAAAAGPAADDAGLTLAGLIDLLDRADDGVGPRRPRPRRAVVHRSPAARPGTRRTTPSRPVPLRSVRPAPPARVPAAAAAPPAPGRPVAEPSRGLRARLRALVRRVAL